MAFILLPLCFFLVYISFTDLHRHHFTEGIVRSTLVFSVLVVAGTELLSIPYIFNFTGVFMYWSALCILLSVYLYSTGIAKAAALYISSRKLLPSVLSWRNGIAILLLLLVILAFIKCVAYPPNNWDSMTYHMSRVAHWASNSSARHYPTHVYRQLYQPPFAEFVIAHIYILSKNDMLSNAVQLCYLLAILACTFSLAQTLGLNRMQTFFALLFVLTLPGIIEQASTTQNDIVVSFFILAAAYYAIISLKTNKAEDILLLSVASGLGILTKGIAYIYLAPILCLWGILYIIRVLKKKDYSRITLLLLIPCFVFTLNAGHFSRNYKLTGSVLGAPEEIYNNEEITAKTLFSNAIRNTGLHFQLFFIDKITEEIILKTLSMLDIDKNDTKNTFQTTFFGLHYWAHNEDNASNTIQLVLFIAAGFFLWRVKGNYFYFYLIIVSQFILFCLILKWQPWHSRLHTPLFILAAIPTSVALSRYLKIIWFKSMLLFAMLAYAFILILFDYSRPLISIPPYTSSISMRSPRFDKYFPLSDELKTNYAFLNTTLEKKGEVHVGLMYGITDIGEYPLWINNQKKEHPEFYHINVKNPSRFIVEKDTSKLDCIIAESTSDSISFKNTWYKKASTFRVLNIYE